MIENGSEWWKVVAFIEKLSIKHDDHFLPCHMNLDRSENIVKESYRKADKCWKGEDSYFCGISISVNNGK